MSQLRDMVQDWVDPNALRVVGGLLLIFYIYISFFAKSAPQHADDAEDKPAEQASKKTD